MQHDVTLCLDVRDHSMYHHARMIQSLWCGNLFKWQYQYSLYKAKFREVKSLLQSNWWLNWYHYLQHQDLWSENIVPKQLMVQLMQCNFSSQFFCLYRTVYAFIIFCLLLDIRDGNCFDKLVFRVSHIVVCYFIL